MSIFLGYFIWGLILAAPLAFVIWRFDLLRWFPQWTAPRRAAPCACRPNCTAW